MPIHFISGKPGGGKTLYAFKLIVEELVHGTRPVYTNLPILLGRLNEWLQKEYPDKTIDLHARLRLLTDDEAGRFWCYRPGCEIRCLTKPEWEGGKRPDYSGVMDAGVFYVIDEIHNYFNARAWMETGRDVLFYLSQHRKLGDTVICITQAINNVDKQFRSVSQDYTYLRNLSKERMGLFKLPSVFVRKTYGAPATDTSKPMEQGMFKLYPSELASCYETAKGVGIHGRAGGDVNERKKGVNWLVGAVGIPILLILFWQYAPQVIASGWSTTKQVSKVATTNSVPALPSPVASSKPVVLESATVMPPAPARQSPVFGVDSKSNVVGDSRGEKIYMTGLVQIPGKPLTIFLSDGRRYKVTDVAVNYVARDYCIVEGVKYRTQF